MADVIETDYTTDPPTVTERAFTPEEKAQRKADADAAAKAAAEREQLQATRTEARRKIAEASGLTADEMTALGII